jgi:hypothetical protein
MLDAIGKRYEMIERHADELAADAINSGEPWTRGITKSTSDDLTMTAVRIVAAYRERWDISGPEPLGHRPDQSAHSTQHADHRRLTEMLRRLSADSRHHPRAGTEQSSRTQNRTL